MADVVTIKNLGSENLVKIFEEFPDAVQNQVVKSAFRKSFSLILNQAKTNFNMYKKGKSHDNYASFFKAFTSEPLSSQVGHKGGVKNTSPSGYKGWWLEAGSFKTGIRSYVKKNSKTKKPHVTGKMPAYHFFYSAVDDKKDEAMESVNENIITSLERVAKRYGAI